ncbi:MAG: hypothetical protein IJ067_11640 [Prevotella sp.]|nr:hypothetical protein [Prevotella sp.]
MKRFLMMSILMLTALASQAQTKEYAKSSMFVSRPEINLDKVTKKTTAVWHPSNMSWIKATCEAKDVAIERNYLKMFPEVANMLQDVSSIIPLSWRLTEEGGETVLHCYLRMPADEVSNLFLASEETCLVDQETGAQYRIRRTEPDTYNKHFTVKAKQGDVLDLKIFFAPLSETTKDIRIYGVSNWGMMGLPVTIRQQVYMSVQYYDTIPQFHKPRLLKEHMYENKPYDRQDWNTWKVMTDAHLIKPLQDETMALWRTPEATYLAIGCEQNWTREYWEFRKDIKLLDETGHQYKLREIQGLPMDELFFMEGMAGDYVAYVLVFDPIPLSASAITYIEPAGEPFSAWGANWSGKVLTLDIQRLHDNQRLFDYHPRVVVK